MAHTHAWPRRTATHRIAAAVCCTFLFLAACPQAAFAQAQPPIVLGQTTVDPAGGRVLSGLVNFDVTDPTTGVVVEQDRELKYTTPANFATRAAGTVNLWLIFHGGGGNTDTMNRYFDVIPDSAPTVLVFPGATGTGGNTKWRGVNAPGDETLEEQFFDIIFVEQLVANLLSANPQLHPGKVYASGFSSGANETWMLLCYRSALFQGFAMFSQQLTTVKTDGGCGNGHLQDPATQQWTVQTGYELLTGAAPDRYGYNPDLPASQQVNPTKAVFYSHGTADDNLVYTGAEGCASGGLPACDASEDPLLSQDSGGPLQDRDDISTKNWLLARHDLLDTIPPGTILLDQDPLTADSVTTLRRTYRTSLGTAGVTSRRTVRWLEMCGGVHAMSTLDHDNDLCTNISNPPPRTLCNDNLNASKDYETALEAQRFFERYAGMLQ